MSTQQTQSAQQTEQIVVQISTGDLNTLHVTKEATPNGAGFTSQTSGATALSIENILHEIHANVADDNITSDDNIFDDQEHILKVKTTTGTSKTDDICIQYQTSTDHDAEDVSAAEQHPDTLRWFRMGTDRSVTPSDTSNTYTSKHDSSYMPLPSQEEQYEEFVLHLRHAASYKAEYDIYQVLAYRAKISFGQKIYFKPFKALRGMISDSWSELEIRWLNSFQRVLSQAIVCFCIQTLGVTAILITQFSAYFSDKTDYAQCDYHPDRWRTDWHLKLLAFLWTSFIALGVSGWVYRARHSGFYPVLLFLKAEQYPNFVSIPILQIGLLTNYYVVASSVIGSFILIYQTEGGTQTIDMILQAVALFFILELDNKIVHARDFLSIRKYFDVYIKNGKHQKLPQSVLPEKQSVFMKPLRKCKGNSCLSATLSIVGFVLLVTMTVGAFLAPLIIMICW